MNRVISDIQFPREWRDVHPVDHKTLRMRLMRKHGSLTRAAERLGKDYHNLSHALHGRIAYRHIIAAIQSDLELSNETVLQLWPQLGEWPKSNGNLPPAA